MRVLVLAALVCAACGLQLTPVRHAMPTANRRCVAPLMEEVDPVKAKIAAIKAAKAAAAGGATATAAPPAKTEENDPVKAKIAAAKAAKAAEEEAAKKAEEEASEEDAEAAKAAA